MRFPGVYRDMDHRDLMEALLWPYSESFNDSLDAVSFCPVNGTYWGVRSLSQAHQSPVHMGFVATLVEAKVQRREEYSSCAGIIEPIRSGCVAELAD